MKRSIIFSKYGWILLLGTLILLNTLISGISWRLDLTEEKRFTLSASTIRLLESVDRPIEIEVLLEGDLPAGFRKLANRGEDILNTFRDLSGNNVRFQFHNPTADLPDSIKAAFIDSLRSLGINATNVKAQTKEGEEQQLVYPGALIKSGDRIAGVDFLEGQNFAQGLTSLNNAEALLEFKLISGIQRVLRDTLPLVGYLVGNGEPVDYRVYDLIERTLRPNYAFRLLPIDQVSAIPTDFKALIIAKPTILFSEGQKFKIDQYAMHGGRVMWMLDNLYASLDSLQRSEGKFVAFDMGLNLEDQLFRYGIRINPDLVQDLQCDQIPSVIGTVGDKPQIQMLPWPYFPLLSSTSGHPIAKNLDYVLAQFPQSIDTVEAPGIRKTILLASSTTTRVLKTPAIVEWNSIRNEEDLRRFNQQAIPVGVLLEGKFTSLFSGRLSKSLADSLAMAGQTFLSAPVAENRMIVVSDGELVLNPVSQQEGPLRMGENLYTRQQHGNREFFLNAMTYLTDESGILEARAKDITLRLLDKSRFADNRLVFQLLNVVLPVLFVAFFIFIFRIYRRHRFGKV